MALFMNRQIILSQKMGKKFFRRKQLATLSQRSPVNWFSSFNRKEAIVAKCEKCYRNSKKIEIIFKRYSDLTQWSSIGIPTVIKIQQLHVTI